ncbi:hypothetical protein BJ166DRAFT_82506 [Pestalotiopsis sp. NC0098]|nr:hypothetical protein BJ166DRAFT_82506 [Pestalotiopsis sp. NC0098]
MGGGREHKEVTFFFFLFGRETRGKAKTGSDRTHRLSSARPPFPRPPNLTSACPLSSEVARHAWSRGLDRSSRIRLSNVCLVGWSWIGAPEGRWKNRGSGGWEDKSWRAWTSPAVRCCGIATGQQQLYVQTFPAESLSTTTSIRGSRDAVSSCRVPFVQKSIRSADGIDLSSIPSVQPHCL